jgi:hypothetical protein
MVGNGAEGGAVAIDHAECQQGQLFPADMADVTVLLLLLLACLLATGTELLFL